MSKPRWVYLSLRPFEATWNVIAYTPIRWAVIALGYAAYLGWVFSW